MEIGNDNKLEKPSKTAKFDFDAFPEISELLSELNPTDLKAVEELACRSPEEKWCSTAARIGIDERQLRNIRRKDSVREAVFRIKMSELRAELPEIFSILTKKALSGDLTAVRLYLDNLEYMDEYIHRFNERWRRFFEQIMEEFPDEVRTRFVERAAILTKEIILKAKSRIDEEQ